ncbi:hypothetical protein [Microbacterium immunditiarum]|uniref:Lysylphosphatidylglycerol synthetase-like protein (DUF2156 family) n=1 Tax=Microbacterium immunditiarum TaxID=337480 RepID=A0A7Y9GS02_9MICO|nr:hypothetical protein [Microbacterium immunditiarum]NYE21296.1 lysylphosphatidylglycerol synthetase-like protein (DUF2156 family) [Microbacterium immunditiarum]
MSPPPVSTSLERTYRYLRIGVAGAVVVIFTAIGVTAASVGWLTSVSDYYYTTARDAFVGALVAVALALVALSGRGAERFLLDAAAVFAPLIAVVPTTLVPGSIPGVEVACDERCFPREFEADVATGVTTYLIVGTLTVLVALLLVALRQTALASIAASLVFTAAVLVAVALTWTLARDHFLEQGHFAATVAFFALFAAVALRNAFPRREAPPRPVFRVLYTGIAVGLALLLVLYVALLPRADATGVPVVLITEAAALGLFFAFWVAQGIEKWRDPDPRLAAAAQTEHARTP